MLTRFPLTVKIDVDVLADLLGLSDIVVGELHEGSVRVREVLDSHLLLSLNDLRFPLSAPI